MQSTRLLARRPYVFDRFKFSRFFPVVFGCSFLDSALQFWFLSKSYGFLASNLKPQAFLLNGTLLLNWFLKRNRNPNLRRYVRIVRLYYLLSNPSARYRKFGQSPFETIVPNYIHISWYYSSLFGNRPSLFQVSQWSKRVKHIP